MMEETDSRDFAFGAFVRIISGIQRQISRFKIAMIFLVAILVATIELIFASPQSPAWLFVSRTTSFAISFLVLAALFFTAWAAGSANKSTRLLSNLTESISFMMLPARGADPTLRIRNQILETSDYFGNLVEKKPEIMQTNVRLKGLANREYDFSVFLHNPSSLWWRYFDIGETGDDVFVKRFEQERPVDKDQIIDVKRSVQECMIAKGTFPVPSRVYVVSPSGFTQDAVKYVTSSRGEIAKRHFLTKYTSNLQLVVERDNGWFEILNF